MDKNLSKVQPIKTEITHLQELEKIKINNTIETR